MSHSWESYQDEEEEHFIFQDKGFDTEECLSSDDEVEHDD